MLECFDMVTAGHMPGTSALFSALPCTGVALPFTVPQDVVRKRNSAHATRADCPASPGRSECVGNKIAVAPVESTGDPESDQEAARDKQTQVEGTYAKKPFIDIVRARPRPAVHTAPGILYGQIGTGTSLIGRDMRLHTDGQGAERGAKDMDMGMGGVEGTLQLFGGSVPQPTSTSNEMDVIHPSRRTRHQGVRERGTE